MAQPTAQQLDRMLAQIALYPDQLLGEVLMASTYPLEIVEAARWLGDPGHAALKGQQLGAALKPLDWAPSVKSLVAFPNVLRMLNDRLDWTERLGLAFRDDPRAVMDAVQRLRRQARANGRLVAGPQASVSLVGEAIVIAPPEAQTVAVPVCDPSVYGGWPSGAPEFDPQFFPGAVAGAFGCQWVSEPVIAPLWGWAHVDWLRRRIDLDRDRLAGLNRIHSHRGDGAWRHDANRETRADDNLHGDPNQRAKAADVERRALRTHASRMRTVWPRAFRAQVRPPPRVGARSLGVVPMRVRPVRPAITSPVIAAPHFTAPHIAAPRLAAPRMAAPHIAAPPHIGAPR